jgi:uncharacterized membrane protein YphA (DoxX/SURF4 family)
MPPARKALPWVGFAIRICAACVWIIAGAAKVPDLEGFRSVVERYGILPRPLAAPFAFVLPFVEIALGLYMAGGLFVQGTAAAGTLLMTVFLSAQGLAWARGLTLDCGCFGTVVQGSSVGPLTMLRDVALGLPTFLMLALPARRLSIDKRLFVAKDFFDVPRG